MTLERRWELKQDAPSWAGVLSTAGGLVLSGDNEGNVLAVDARTGTLLWQDQTGAPIYAAPMTYAISGRQYVTIASGTTLIAFAQESGLSRLE